MATKGIPNLGEKGSSQMSVSLQVLMNICKFLDFLNHHLEECIRVKCLMCSFGKLMKFLQTDDKEALMNMLKELYEECSGDAVNDVFDFFVLLLSKLQNAQGTVSGTGKEATIEELFGGSQTVTGTCLNCEFTESNTEPFHVLEIPLEKKVETVQEALESYLIGTVEKSRCPKCNQCEAVYCAELNEMPAVLCLHFLRPTEINEVNERRLVTISDKLSVSNVVYQLSSVVHSESNYPSTHYTCVLKCRNGSLVQCNDTRVKQMSYGALLSGNLESDVCMVLYERINVPPSQPSTPKRNKKVKKKAMSTSKKWVSESFQPIENNQEIGFSQDDTTDEPFILHKRKRLRLDSVNTGAESKDSEEGEAEIPNKKREEIDTNTKEETAVCYKKNMKIVYIRCMISYELWNENMSEKDFQFFTGLSKFNFEALYVLLDGKDGLMRLKYLYDMTTPRKIPKTPPKLSPKSRLLLMLVRMRRGTPLRDLAYQFGISTAWAGFIFFAVLRKVANTFKSVERSMFLTRQQQQQNRPAAFKPFPDVRIIIDGVEFRTQTPSNAQQQNNTFSQYKHYNTFKYVVGISCYGGLIFVSEGFEGSKTDKEILKKCGLMELLEPGDAVMCDRGFNVAPELLKIGVKTIKPPSMRGVKAMEAPQQLYNSAVSQARIYIEHAIGKMKDFRLLRFTIPLNMRGVMDDLVLVAAHLTNFSDRAIKSRTKKRRSKYDD